MSSPYPLSHPLCARTVVLFPSPPALRESVRSVRTSAKKEHNNWAKGDGANEVFRTTPTFRIVTYLFLYNSMLTNPYRYYLFRSTLDQRLSVKLFIGNSSNLWNNLKIPKLTLELKNGSCTKIRLGVNNSVARCCKIKLHRKVERSCYSTSSVMHSRILDTWR